MTQGAIEGLPVSIPGALADDVTTALADDVAAALREDIAAALRHNVATALLHNVATALREDVPATLGHHISTARAQKCATTTSINAPFARNIGRSQQRCTSTVICFSSAVQDPKPSKNGSCDAEFGGSTSPTRRTMSSSHFNPANPAIAAQMD